MNEDILYDKIRQWRYDPYLFVVEVLGAKPLSYRVKNPDAKVITSQQEVALRELGELVLAKKKLENASIHKLTDREKMLIKKTGISIKSGKGSGKTAFLAWITIWFLMCFPNAIVPCTASKLDQVKDVLWREISKWVTESEKSGKYGSIVRDTLKVEGEKVSVRGHSGIESKRWYAIARSASTTAGSDTPAETLQGFHEDHMMIIIDEATGVPDNVFMPLDQTLTSPCNFLVLTYNPTRTSGYAYRSQHKNKEEFLCYRWNCEDSENVSRDSIERVVRKYGKDSNAYRISVQGLEPVGDSDTVIPLEWVMAAVNRDVEPAPDDPIISCVDLARQGDDKSIILTRQGMRVDPVIKSFNGQNTMEMAGWASLHMAEEAPTCFGLDLIGMGYGVYDRLKEQGFRVTGINVSESTSKKEKFERLRDELWWKTREAFEMGAISIPDDEELIFELSNVKYKVESNGKIKIESKREMRNRGVQSPNKADALVLTFYFNDRSYRKRVEEDAYSRARMKQQKRMSREDSWMSV